MEELWCTLIEEVDCYFVEERGTLLLTHQRVEPIDLAKAVEVKGKQTLCKTAKLNCV